MSQHPKEPIEVAAAKVIYRMQHRTPRGMLPMFHKPVMLRPAVASVGERSLARLQRFTESIEQKKKRHQRLRRKAKR